MLRVTVTHHAKNIQILSMDKKRHNFSVSAERETNSKTNNSSGDQYIAI